MAGITVFVTITCVADCLEPRSVLAPIDAANENVIIIAVLEVL